VSRGASHGDSQGGDAPAETRSPRCGGVAAAAGGGSIPGDLDAIYRVPGSPVLNPPPATDDDVAILRTALAALDRSASWNRHEVQACPDNDQTNTGLFCVVYHAVESRMGRYHHRQPALQLVRAVISERWRDRITSHQHVDFNNHPATTLADLKTVLEVAMERAGAQAKDIRP